MHRPGEGQGCPLPHPLPAKVWAEHQDNTSLHPTTFSVKEGSDSPRSGERPHSVPSTPTRRAGSCQVLVAGPPFPLCGLRRPDGGSESTPTHSRDRVERRLQQPCPSQPPLHSLPGTRSSRKPLRGPRLSAPSSPGIAPAHLKSLSLWPAFPTLSSGWQGGRPQRTWSDRVSKGEDMMGRVGVRRVWGRLCRDPGLGTLTLPLSESPYHFPLDIHCLSLPPGSGPVPSGKGHQATWRVT